MSDRHITCEQVIAQLFDYLDRELDAEVSGRIDEHMERCRDCFSRAEFERRLRARLHEATEVAAPERLQRRLRGIIDKF